MEQQDQPQASPESAPPASNSKMRTVAIAATAIALVAIAIPFVWNTEEKPSAAGSAAAVTPAASHDAVASAETASCMADAKPANWDFKLKDLDGKEVSLAAFAGRPLLLNFYATWCGPCRVETPDLVALQKARPDITVIGILWMDEDGDARAFAQQYGITYPMLNGNRHDELDDRLGPIEGLPRSVVIDRQGRIAAIHEGATLRPTFERDLAALK